MTQVQKSKIEAEINRLESMRGSSIEDAKIEGIKITLKALGYKAVKRSGKWIVAVDLYSLRGEAEAMSLPEDPRIYGDC